MKEDIFEIKINIKREDFDILQIEGINNAIITAANKTWEKREEKVLKKGNIKIMQEWHNTHEDIMSKINNAYPFQTRINKRGEIKWTRK